jgi:hypothetical protein
MSTKSFSYTFYEMQGSVVKMGPCGGGDGNAWKMDMQGVNRIVKVIADPAALDCPRCLRPLAPRVYQVKYLNVLQAYK